MTVEERLRSTIEKMKPYDDGRKVLKTKEDTLKKKVKVLTQQQKEAFSYKREDELLANVRELTKVSEKLEALLKSYYSEENTNIRQMVFDYASEHMEAVIGADETIKLAMAKAEQAAVKLLEADTEYLNRHNQLKADLWDEFYNDFGYEGMNQEPNGYEDRFRFNTIDRISVLGTTRELLEYYLAKLKGEK